MTTDNATQAAVAQAFERMSDAEAMAWIDGGDYTSVAGVPLPDSVSKRFAVVLSLGDVEGFDASFGAGASALPGADQGSFLGSIFKSCAQGTHIKEATITHRKAGKDPVDY